MSYLPSESSTVTVTVSGAPPGNISTALTLTVSPTSGSAPLSSSASGKLTRADTGAGVAGKTVAIYVDNNFVGSTTTASNGNYSFSLQFSTAGTYAVKAKFAGG